MAANVKIRGLKELKRDLERLDKQGTILVDQLTEATARDIQIASINRAPANFGSLRQGIKVEKVTDLTYRIVAKERYSAYVEFGTGGLVRVPTELKELAIKFKGKGIKQINLRPRPYLWPSFKRGTKDYIIDLNQLLDKLVTKI